MARKQTRRTISVSRALFEESQDYAEAQGRSLSNFCEEGLRLVGAGAKDPAELAVFLEDLARSVESDNWDAALCADALRRKAEHLRSLALTIKHTSDRSAPVERIPRLAGVPPSLPKIDLKRAGGYAPTLGSKHPDNLDPTLDGYADTLASVGWTPEQIKAEQQRRKP